MTSTEQSRDNNSHDCRQSA